MTVGSTVIFKTYDGRRFGLGVGAPGAAALIVDGNIIYSPNVADTEQHTNMQLAAATYLLESVNSALTALSGGGQTGATLLNAEINYVTTATSTNIDSTMLPPSKAGMTVTVINKSGFNITVFGNTSDTSPTIDGGAANASINQMNGSSTVYFCPVAGVWTTNGAAEGYSAGGFLTQSFSSALTASSTLTLSSTMPVFPAMLNYITAGNAAASSICYALPPAQAGMEISIINVSSLACNIFPNYAINTLVSSTAQDSVNGQTSGLGATIAASSNPMIAFCATNGKWYTK